MYIDDNGLSRLNSSVSIGHIGHILTSFQYLSLMFAFYCFFNSHFFYFIFVTVFGLLEYNVYILLLFC